MPGSGLSALLATPSQGSFEVAAFVVPALQTWSPSSARPSGSVKTTRPADGPAGPWPQVSLTPEPIALLHQEPRGSALGFPPTLTACEVSRPGPSFLLLHTSLLLSQGGAVRSVMMAFSGTHWGSLGPPSPASHVSAVETWTPTLWATVTPCLVAACDACTTRQVSAANTARKASTGVPWPLGPQTNACVSTSLPGPQGGAGRAPSPPDPAGCSARLLCSLRQFTFSVALSRKCKGLFSSRRFFQLRDLINSDPVNFFFVFFLPG